MRNCLRCGRKLTSARSVRDGMGRHCKFLVSKKIRTMQDFKPFQISKAIELIEQGGILRSSRHPRMFTVVNSKGDGTYLTAAQVCTCPAGRMGRTCYHRAGVVLLTR